MGFTRAEFLRGVVAAWVWFLLLHQVALLFPFFGYGVYALLATFPWSLGAAVVGAPLAYALGYVLRRQPRILWHVVAFAGLGLLVGAVATALAMWLPAWGVPGDAFGSVEPYAVAVAVSAGPAVALGWWHTARRALATDRGVPVRRPRVDPDAAYEDSL